ncbi:hypothetical protein C8R44DRAFT_888282 [Mycena epipterygia]|nr:hypothetical protein C8R44DRAFT_888282 [Mycena epipterygia]
MTKETEKAVNFSMRDRDLGHPRYEATAQLYHQMLVYAMWSGPSPKETSSDSPKEALSDEAGQSVPTITEGTDVWWYDTDDYAREWWVDWGLLKERSMDVELDVGSPLMSKVMNVCLTYKNGRKDAPPYLIIALIAHCASVTVGVP